MKLTPVAALAIFAAAAAAYAPLAAAKCSNCGEVIEVKTVQQKGEASGGGAVLGGIVGGVIGHQIGSGNANKAATAGGAVIGAAIAHNRAVRNGTNPPPPREYTVQRCETRYQEEWQERVDGYRVAYMYQGRRMVTELPYRPGDRIRVRVAVTPAES